MTEEQLREELQKIQAKYYTPTSKIAEDIKIAGSYVGRFINNKFQENETASQRLLDSLEQWVVSRL